MNHYTYLLIFPDGMKYIGARSTKLLPELDACYLGSGTYLPERTRASCVKLITGKYKTRVECIEAEIKQIIDADAINSPLFYNKRLRTFDKHGLTKDTCEGIKRTAEKLKGRTKEYFEYIQRANQKRKSYSGVNRTPAQIEGQKKVAKTITGTKNPKKAKHGIENGGFNPWYYITPDGEYYEVYNKTKGEMANVLGFTQRQLTHRFHYTNKDKPGKTGIFKGWVFGDLTAEQT